jgi:hypothetical protein
MNESVKYGTVLGTNDIITIHSSFCVLLNIYETGLNSHRNDSHDVNKIDAVYSGVISIPRKKSSSIHATAGNGLSCWLRLRHDSVDDCP